MRRFAKLPSRRLFVAWLLCLGVTLLVGFSLVGLTQPQSAGAAARPLSVTPTPAHPSTLTATPHSGTADKTGQAASADKSFHTPSWLGEGLAVVFFLLLGLSLILFPIVVRSARIERRSRPAFSPQTLPDEQQVERFTQIAPERKEPLSRDEWQALREAAREKVGQAPRTTRRLAEMRVVDGVPVTVPLAEPETVLRLPEPSHLLAHYPAEDSALEAEAALEGSR